MQLIEEHYREHYEHYVRVAQSKGLPFFLAEEVAQDTYVNALENIHAYDELACFDKWLNQILNNAIRKTHKRERHRGMMGVSKDVVDLFQDVAEAYKETNDR